MSNQLVKFQTTNGEVELSPQIIKQYLVNGDVDKISDQEVKMFTELCKYRQLNPFLKEAHLIKFGNIPAQLVVAYDVFISRSEQNPHYQGFKSGVTLLANSDLIYREGALRLPNEQVVGGWCEVYRDDYKNPVRIEVTFDEYVGTKANGEVNKQWKTKPAFMITKVAEGQGHRKAFPNDFKGMYLEEENAPVTSNDNNFVESEVVDTITNEERKHLFELAKGDNKIILKAMVDTGYSEDDKTSVIIKDHYEHICTKINELVNEK